MAPRDYDEDERWRDALDVIREINETFQQRQNQADKDRDALRTEVGKLREDMSRQMLTYWQATSAGLRQLSDWWAETEDAARRERRAARETRDRRERIIIGLLIGAIVFGAILYLYR